MYIPDDLKLTMAKRFDKRDGLAVIGRETQTLYSTGGTDYISNTQNNGGQWIEFRLPNPVGVATYDLSTFFIHFNFIILGSLGGTSIAKTNVNHARVFVHDSIESIIKTVETYVGSQLCERIDNYANLETCLNLCGVNQNYLNKFGSVCFGAGLNSTQRTQLYTNQDNTSTTISFRENSFSIPIRASGLFSPALQLPAVFGSAQYCMIRLELSGPSNCIYAAQETPISLSAATGVISGGTCSDITNSNTALRYQLSQVRATCDVIYYSNEYSQLLNNMIASSRLEFPIKTWDVQSFSIASGQSRSTFSMSFPYNSVDSFILWFHRSSELGVFNKAGADRLIYPSSSTFNLSSAQLKIGGKNYPNTPISMGGQSSGTRAGSSEAFIHLQSALANLENGEVLGNYSYTPNIQNFSASVVSGALYYQNSFNLPFGGDIFYGRNRNETASGSIGGSNVSSFAEGLNLNNTSLVHTCTSGMFNPYINEMSPSSFALGFNLRKLTKESQLGVSSGMDIASSGGLVSVQLEFSGSTTESYTCMVGCLHTRFLTVQGQNVGIDF